MSIVIRCPCSHQSIGSVTVTLIISHAHQMVQASSPRDQQQFLFLKIQYLRGPVLETRKRCHHHHLHNLILIFAESTTKLYMKQDTLPPSSTQQSQTSERLITYVARRSTPSDQLHDASSITEVLALRPPHKHNTESSQARIPSPLHRMVPSVIHPSSLSQAHPPGIQVAQPGDALHFFISCKNF